MIIITFCQVTYLIHKQMLLEALCWQDGGGHRHALLPYKASKRKDIEEEFEMDSEEILKLLKSCEKLASKEVWPVRVILSISKTIFF